MTAAKRGRQRRVTVAMMRQHVEELVAKHVPWDVPVIQCKGLRDARTLWHGRELLEISLPPVKSAVSYATALHELGHILGRYQHSPKVMTCEGWAWLWAKQTALIWTPRMRYTSGEALMWYAAQVMRRTEQRRQARRRLAAAGVMAKRRQR